MTHGAIIFVPDKSGNFPIDYAGYFNHQEIVEMLVNHSIQAYSKLRVKQRSNTGIYE